MSTSWLAPEALPGTTAAEVIARPTTGASVAVAGCRIELMCRSPFPYGVMSWVVSGNVTAGPPVTISWIRSRSSGSGRMYTCLTGGDSARPRWVVRRMCVGVSVEITGSRSVCAVCPCVMRDAPQFDQAVSLVHIDGDHGVHLRAHLVHVHRRDVDGRVHEGHRIMRQRRRVGADMGRDDHIALEAIASAPHAQQGYGSGQRRGSSVSVGDVPDHLGSSADPAQPPDDAERGSIPSGSAAPKAGDRH